MRRIVVLVVLVGGSARADAPTELFAEGRALLDAGHPAEACAKFEAALRGDPTAAGTMLNLGLCNRQLHRYATALRWFRKALADSSVSGLAEHEQAAKDMTVELVALVPSLTIAIAGDARDAAVTVDRQPLAATDFENFEVDPGPHEIVVHAGGRVATRTVTVAEHDHQRVAIDVGSAQLPRSSLPMYLWIGGGVLGLAAIGWEVGAVSPARSRLTDATTQYAYEAGKASYESDRRIAVGLYAAAAATIVVGAVLRATVYRYAELAPIRIDATAGGATVGMAGTW